jgi:CRP-like cAMP-binding protein
VTVTEFLKTRVAFLGGITEEQALALASRVEQRSYAAGQTVVFRGTSVDGLSVVASGRVGIWVKIKNAPAPVMAAELKTGEVFGEGSLLESGMAGATVKAIEDETLVFVIAQEAFFEVLAEAPELRSRAEALLAERRRRNSEMTVN